MKRLLIIPILFICFLSKGQAVDSASIIGKSLKLGNLIVAQNDFPNQMNWDDAKKACTSLGNGWRLPTQYELEILNKNKAIISGFTNGSYWSSNDRVFLFAWQQVFLFDDQSNTGYLPSGSTGWSMKHTPNHVRAIRGPELQEELSNMSFTSIMEHLSKYLFFGFLIFVVIITIYMKMNPSAIHDPNSFLNRTLNLIKIISKNMPANVLRSRMDRPMDRPALLKIDNLEIYPNDLPYPMEWNDAKKACASLGDGWRLPTKDELNILYKNRQNIGGFDIVNYWSSTEFAYMYAWKQHFFTGIRFFKRNTGRHRYSYNVRPVRTI
jgi:hypothetical protein